MTEFDQAADDGEEIELKPLVVGKGYCFATNYITQEGALVGFMFREEPEDEEDSGWRFLSGMETQEYLDDPENGALYDLNAIANCDEDVIPLLDYPIGTAFEREEDTEKFVEVDMNSMIDDEGEDE